MSDSHICICSYKLICSLLHDTFLPGTDQQPFIKPEIIILPPLICLYSEAIWERVCSNKKVISQSTYIYIYIYIYICSTFIYYWHHPHTNNHRHRPLTYPPVQKYTFQSSHYSKLWCFHENRQISIYTKTNTGSFWPWITQLIRSTTATIKISHQLTTNFFIKPS